MRAKAGTRKRKRLVTAIICTALILGAAVLASPTRGILSAHYGMDTTAGRQTYLHDLGWEIDPASEDIREIKVPKAFDRTMADYNTLQREQGFDLLPYAGMLVTIVTYALSEAPETFVTLWICDGVVIAGDVHTTAIDGWMRAIVQE